MRELRIGDTIRIRKTVEFKPLRTEEEVSRSWMQAARRAWGRGCVGGEPLEPTELFTIQNEVDLEKARQLCQS